MSDLNMLMIIHVMDNHLITTRQVTYRDMQNMRDKIKLWSCVETSPKLACIYIQMENDVRKL